MLYSILWVWPVGLSHSLSLCPWLSLRRQQVTDCLSYFRTYYFRATVCLIFHCGPLIRTSTPAHRLCLSLKQACFIEPTHTADIFGFEDISLPDFCSHSLFGEFILTSKSFSPPTVSDVILWTTRVGLLVFHSGLGITCLSVGVITSSRIFTERARCYRVLSAELNLNATAHC